MVEMPLIESLQVLCSGIGASFCLGELIDSQMQVNENFKEGVPNETYSFAARVFRNMSAIILAIQVNFLLSSFQVIRWKQLHPEFVSPRQPLVTRNGSIMVATVLLMTVSLLFRINRRRLREMNLTILSKRRQRNERREDQEGVM